MGLAVSVSATLVSYLAPTAVSATLVGFVFLGATYWLCLRRGAPSARASGLALGGLFEDAPLDLRRIARELGEALAWTLGLSIVIFPLFGVGFALWYEPRVEFSWTRALYGLDGGAAGGLFDLVLGHLVVVALPEEAFFRGYLQSRLDERWGTPRKFLGAPIGAGLLWTSALFALGHLATTPHPARLAVFFPSLLFGWLRARTGGVGAPVLFHAACNVVAAFVSAGYGYAV